MEQKGQYTSKKFMPDLSLASYVDNYWTFESYQGNSENNSYARMFPLGYPMVEFNLSDKWVKRSICSNETDNISSNITSFTNKPFILRPLGKIRTVVARLHPLALRKILGDDIQKNVIFDPHLVFGQKFRETEEKIALAKNWREIKIHLDEFFTGVFESSRIEVDKRARHLMRIIIANGGTTNLRSATKELGISQRRIEQLFNTHIGMSPKAYAGIVQFQKALAMYQPTNSLTDLTYVSGYYDQSHFIRHFKSLTNVTPREFFKKECIYTCKISNLYNFSL